MRHRRKLFWGGVLALLVWACSDSTKLSGPRLSAPESFRATIGGFSCGVSYDAITQTNETELAPYEVEAVTDTARICEGWTGTDYNAEITQIGSSEPASDYSEDVGTVIYQTGTTSDYDKTGAQMEGPVGVGATSFEFVAATADEQQASYNEPYYAVIQDPDPVHCSNEPCAAMDVQVGIPGAPQPLRRVFLRSLTKGMTEIGLSPEGYRQFRGAYQGGEEVTLSIDPLTELIRRQEVKSAKSYVRADLTWSLINGKFVRELMEVTGEDVIGDRRVTSKTRITLRNVQWDPSAL